jgi:hypothetical protein
VTGCGGPIRFGDDEVPTFSRQLRNGGEVISLMNLLPFTTVKISGTHFCWRLSQPQGLVQLKGPGLLENPMTSSGIEPTILRFVAQCLNQLHYNKEGETKTLNSFENIIQRT